MIVELVLVAVLVLAGGKKSPSAGISESRCDISVEVDDHKLSICRAGARWRMFVDGVLDPRTFSDLPGVLQRAIKETNPAEAMHVRIGTKHGSADVFASEARDSYTWRLDLFVPGSDPTVIDRTVESETPEPTMLDALGRLYEATPSGFFN